MDVDQLDEVDAASGLHSVVEDYSPPSSPIVSDDESDEEEEEWYWDPDPEIDRENNEYQALRGVRPYMFEPLPRPPAQDDGDGGEEAAGGGGEFAGGAAAADEPHPRQHLDVSQWCTCGYCHNMDQAIERVCCKDVDRVMDKCAEAEPEPTCITLHPGFDGVCLDPWVQQLEYASMVQHHGDFDQNFTVEERYRHTAYRSFVRWCWGYLGRRVRRVIPSCAVNKIRATYPSESYRGFRLPPLHMP